ncbi:MAG: saccharopine dehydrogenase NADP-binding domain-containing protein [Myxococcota bacterium]
MTDDVTSPGADPETAGNRTASSPRELDLVLFGATGFTGRLVAEYLAKHRAPGRWAIAGRNREKLAALGFDVPILVADAMDPVALAAVARRTKVVCTTVGPFAKYGSALVAACAEAGTHYCDLTGEVPWMRAMIDAHDAAARASGARIVHACGFDSIPSDLGTLLVQDAFRARFGRPAEKVTAYYGASRGGVSGGTLASGFEMARAAKKDPAVRRLLANPYALDPDPTALRPPAPDERRLGWDRGLRKFTAPFVMAASNTRVVRRSHVLAGEPWGPGFVYREVMATPASVSGLARAAAFTAAIGAFAAVMALDPLRELAAKKAPQPGEGPSKETRDAGFWSLELVAEGGGDRLAYQVSDVGDPGYSSTARMLAEAALCLAHDALPARAGCLTPATAMGSALAERLRGAGLTLAPR